MDLKETHIFSDSPVVYFRRYPDSYLEIETYDEPTDDEMDDEAEPSVMYIRKIVFVQQAEDSELTKLVDDTFSALGWRSDSYNK